MFGLGILDATPFAGVISARMRSRLSHCDMPLPEETWPAKNVRVDRRLLAELGEVLEVDLSQVTYQAVYGMPKLLRGLYWWDPDRGHQVRLNADSSTDNTLIHESKHAGQTQNGFWRPTRLGFEADASRWADALEERFQGILIRD